MPIIKIYKEEYQNPKALDIGCGRGEFIEILIEQGFTAEGVDINQKLIEIAERKGLRVYCDDALSFLRKVQDGYYNLVSLIHVVEHLEFEYLFKLLREIYRVLSPQGCLIIETPYTKNIVLGTYNFWLDPTHLRPVNVKLVKAIGEYLGFVHIDFYPLQSIPPSELRDVRLLDAFMTTSPDVSMVLIKGESKGELLNQLIKVTESLRQRATVDLEQIIDIYDNKVRESFLYLELIKREFNSLKREFNSLKSQIESNSQLLNNIANIANEALARANSVVTSQFWRSYDKLRKLRKFLIRKKKEFSERILRKSQKLTNLSAKEEPLSIEEENLKRRLEFLRRRIRD